MTCVAVLLLAAAPAGAQRIDIGSGSVVATVSGLKPGQFIWEPEIAPRGPMLLAINLATQRAILFRNGVPIGASTVSTGRAGRETPTGIFTILQKQVEHYSSKYDNAPMPYMQPLTWQGVALHAGHLPGYPASHGCIRLPAGFAKALYGATALGMTVVITDRAAMPRIGPEQEMFTRSPATSGPTPATVEWHPESSPAGPVSIVVSVADQRVVVLRNGIVIGSAAVTVRGPSEGAWAYTLQSIDPQGRQRWLRLPFSSKINEPGATVPPEEWQRFDAPADFKRVVARIVEPGTTIVVTSDSIQAGAPPSSVTVLEGPGG
jgi:hypothetical protein